LIKRIRYFAGIKTLATPIIVNRWNIMKTYDDLTVLLHTAIIAAISAGLRALEIYNLDFTVETKSDDSPLTQADRDAHKIIVSCLQTFDLPVLSEEGRDIAYDERRGWERFWMVDPLDGTKEFVKKNGEFTINIALIHEQRPVLGVVYVPVLHRLFFASAGMGAFCCDILDAPTVLNASMDDFLRSSRRLSVGTTVDRPYTIVGSRSHATPELEAYVAEKRRQHDIVDFISAGSSLKFCLVAEGKADVYPRMGPTMEWDTAAGHVVAEQAGAVILRADNGLPMVYNKPNLLNPWFIVTAKD
jgi:3'(2'), 5'-bisphosphate nucleotidase